MLDAMWNSRRITMPLTVSALTVSALLAGGCPDDAAPKVVPRQVMGTDPAQANRQMPTGAANSGATNASGATNVTVMTPTAPQPLMVTVPGSSPGGAPSFVLPHKNLTEEQAAAGAGGGMVLKPPPGYYNWPAIEQQILEGKIKPPPGWKPTPKDAAPAPINPDEDPTKSQPKVVAKTAQ